MNDFCLQPGSGFENVSCVPHGTEYLNGVLALTIDG